MNAANRDRIIRYRKTFPESTLTDRQVIDHLNARKAEHRHLSKCTEKLERRYERSNNQS